jgi:predicted O-methyltransferase YrrM
VIVPPLVRRAEQAVADAGFGAGVGCSAEEGVLLHVLAARRGLLRAAEIGTDFGVSAAWVVSGLPPSVPFLTVDPDPTRAAIAGEAFAADGNVQVLCGDWRTLLPAEAPFDLVVVHLAEAAADPDPVIGLLAPGGTAVVGACLGGSAGQAIHRDSWLDHPALAAADVGVGGGAQLVLATRIR